MTGSGFFLGWEGMGKVLCKVRLGFLGLETLNVWSIGIWRVR
jgi:hypothetical protein